MHSFFEIAPILQANVVGFRGLLQLGDFLGDVGQSVLKVIDNGVNFVKHAF